MEITCYREHELARMHSSLQAATYNLAHTLLEHSQEGVVFVPIRAMQYLAILDQEEFIFLDSDHKNWVEIAWQNFHPQRRNALTDPVEYDLVYYTATAAETMRRLQSEFPRALQALAIKDVPHTPAKVIKLTKKSDS